MWFFEQFKRTPKSKPFQIQGNLYLENLQSEENGNYFCYTYSRKRSTYEMSVATVRVYGKFRSKHYCI